MAIATKENICGLINSGEIALSFATNLKQNVINEYKDISKDTTEEFLMQEEANEIEKNREVAGVFVDSSKSFLINCYNQAVQLNGIIQKNKFDFVDNIIKEYETTTQTNKEP